MAKTIVSVADQTVIKKIFVIRDQKVMLDFDLSDLYQIETKQLKRAVRRNLARFPEDFMFELNSNEFAILRSQIGTSSWGGSRYPPMAFTEQGVAMLSSVLNSSRAIAVEYSNYQGFYTDEKGHTRPPRCFEEVKSTGTDNG